MQVKDEKELASLGIAIDPENRTLAIVTAKNEEPTLAWTLVRLAGYASGALLEAGVLSRKCTVAVFRAGRALSLAQAKLKETNGWGAWGAWLENHRICRTSAWESIQLFERAGSEGAIANMTISEAKRKLGINGEPPKPKPKPKPARKPEPEPITVSAGQPISLRISDHDDDDDEIIDDPSGETVEYFTGDGDDETVAYVLDDEGDVRPAAARIMTIPAEKLDTAIEMWYCDVVRIELIDLLKALGIGVTNENE